MNAANPVELQCYNISVDFQAQNICNYFIHCQSLSIMPYFEKSNGSDLVSLDLSQVDLHIIIPEKCSSICSKSGSSFKTQLESPSESSVLLVTSGTEPYPGISLPSHINGGAMAGIVLSWLVLIAIAVIIIVIISCYKKTKIVYLEQYVKLIINRHILTVTPE